MSTTKKSTKKVTETETKTTEALAIPATIDKVGTLTSERITAPALIEPTKDIIKAGVEAAIAGKHANEVKSTSLKKIATVVAMIDDGKLYKENEFKTISEYCTAIGIENPATASALNRAGHILNNPDTPASVKALPYSILSQLSSVLKTEGGAEAVDKAIEENGGMSLGEAKKFVTEFNDSHGKAKVVEMFVECDHTGQPFLAPTFEPLPLEEHILRATNRAKEDGIKFEAVRLSKSDEGFNRYLYLVNGYEATIHFFKRQEAKTKKVEKVTIDRSIARANTIKSLVSAGLDMNAINGVLALNGYATITENIYNLYKSGKSEVEDMTETK